MTQKIRIEVSAGGFGKIFVDDVDISGNVTGANIRIRPGQTPKIFLAMAADLTVEMDVVKVPA